MNKLVTALFGAVLLLSLAASAQNPQDLPSAPSAMQPRFPGAPAEPPQKPPAPDELKPTPEGALPRAAATNAATEQQSTGEQAAPKSSTPLFAPMNVTPAQPVSEKPLPPEETGEFRIGVQVQLVDLIFTATDKHGRFIKDLKKDDIRLLDEGKPPLRVEAFESETGLPLRVGLLIDASNSIRERFRFEQDAAGEFLHQVVRPDSDRAFVIGFDSISDLTQDYTDDTEALARGIRVLRPGGGTALHDAVYMACDKLAKAPLRGPARRAIILLSDGDDNQSRHTREEAIEAALRAEVIIYVISTSTTDGNKKGDKILMRYAEATGGRVFFPQRLEEVATAFSEIQDELRSQYVVAYKPQNFESDGRYHAISIDVPNRSNVKLRARKGYYAPKSAQ
jgi:VWFA-related protein